VVEAGVVVAAAAAAVVVMGRGGGGGCDGCSGGGGGCACYGYMLGTWCRKQRAWREHSRPDVGHDSFPCIVSSAWATE